VTRPGSGVWSALLHAGIDEGVRPSEVRHITLVNALAVVVALFELSFIPLFLYYLPQTKALLLFVAIAGVLNFGVVFLNRLKLHLLARVSFGFLALVLTTACSILLGRETFTHVYLLVTIVTAFFIYPPREKFFLYAMIVLFSSAFMGLEIWFSGHAGLMNPGGELFTLLKFGSLGGALVLLLAIAFYSNALIYRSEARLVEEQRKSETLLLNILPQPIARRLKADQAYIADRFPEATVLFADIGNFTELTQAMPADSLVAMLNEVFSEFDLITERYGLEKIKTIGDAYMAAGGIPEPLADHCEAIALLALDMQEAMRRKINQTYPGLMLRIGIHSGPVVAGVIGRKKFSYDLWGDSVNTASRMESQGVDGRIQVTSEVYEKLKGRFRFESRGEIEVKGKGRMTAYLLIGREE
jgi:class 3 adenylate cyclase